MLVLRGREACVGLLIASAPSAVSKAVFRITTFDSGKLNKNVLQLRAEDGDSIKDIKSSQGYFNTCHFFDVGNSDPCID